MERDEVLEDEQLVSMKQAFMLFDTDGDGQISPSDLGTIMRSLGSNPTMAEIQEIIDREKLSESIGFDRFMDLMARYLKPQNYEWELREAFRVLDKDCTGFVDVSDLRHILTSIGERLDPHEFDEWIRELDVGSDGRFRYDEFIAQLGDK